MGVLVASSGCGTPERAVPPRAAPDAGSAPAQATTGPHAAALAELLAFEQAARAAADFTALPPSDAALGPDPFALARVPQAAPGNAPANASANASASGSVAVGILRGASAVVALDPEGRELARAPAPASPTGLAVSEAGDVLISGQRELVHFRLVSEPGGPIEAVQQLGTLRLQGARSLRDLALGPASTLYAVDEHQGSWFQAELDRTPDGRLAIARQRVVGRCHGPTRIRHAGGHLVVNCLLDRALAVLATDARGRARPGAPLWIAHDGPLWSFDLVHHPAEGLLIAAGGVEDHPLVRRDGGFGHIDSFVFLYRVTTAASGQLQAQRLAEINLSEHGVVTPKWLRIDSAPDGTVVVRVAGYGSDQLATLTWPAGKLDAAPVLATRTVVPGMTSAVPMALPMALPMPPTDDHWLAASPLLDAWVVLRKNQPARSVPALVQPASPSRDVTARVGEALFFTTLMAPWNRTDGPRSRFTCETCHFEGYVDGRVHHTGRGDVRVATRPLLGLFNNAPHFSRALDSTTTAMVHSEFRVANAGNGRDPWFSLARADIAWLAHLDGVPETLSPEFLRQSLLAFLMVFTHRANPATAGRSRWTELERAGAAVFRDRCEDCHRAQLVADDPGSRVPFADWERLVMAPSGAILWADAVYVETGIQPYVHEHGTRVPPLRRLYKKYPYFTNGSAASLSEVLDRVAIVDGTFYHDKPPTGDVHERLAAQDKAALLAFLDLL